MNQTAPTFVSDPSLQLLIFGGKGGVGKTTCASSSAMAIARQRPKARVLLLSTDPAHSVADCLSDAKAPDNLCVVELSAEAEHRAFMQDHAEHLKTIASRGTFLEGTDIDTFIELSIPGVDELMAFLRVGRWVMEKSFDVIVVDTAPSGHTLKLLSMSSLLNTWLDALDALMAKHHYMASMFASGRRDAEDPADTFLEGLREQVDGLSELLTDQRRCRFVPVMLAEDMSIAETTDILESLSEMGVASPEIVVNRLIDPDAAGAFASQRDAQSRALSRLPKALAAKTLWGAPLDRTELTGSAALERFTMSLRPIAQWQRAGSPGPASATPFRCDGVAQLPAPSARTQLLFFAGKGGVGKTTMACTAAMQLAAMGRRCLIVSTDPAHSLGDCLGATLSDEETMIVPSLNAVEIDAELEFSTLRDEYQEELEEVLDAMFSSIDLSFDREAMEKLLDLAPPGLDECMALLRIVEQIDRVDERGQPLHDTIVIDTAPTGHLLRLLELPELIEHWLQCLFALFIKYDNIFRLPKLQAKLVGISRGIKRLRATLADPTRSRVQMVSIATEMAFSECQDLARSLETLKVSVGTLFINLCLLPDQSALGEAIGEREARVRQKYAAAFPRTNMVTVYRCGDPRGASGLQGLASAVYASDQVVRRAA